LIKYAISRSAAFSPDGKFIAHEDDEGNKGRVAKWLGYDHDDNDDDSDFEDGDSSYEVQCVRVDKVIFSPNGNLLASVGTLGDPSIIKIWDSENGRRSLSTRLLFHQTEQPLQLQEYMWNQFTFEMCRTGRLPGSSAHLSNVFMRFCFRRMDEL
jgi:WD40 repeat protein